MRRSEKLLPVERIATLREQTTARQLADAQNRLAEETERGKQLEALRDEYLQQMKEAGRAGISGAGLRRYAGFSSQLDRMIEVQGEQIRRTDQQLAQVRDNWQKAYGRRRAVAQVKGRFEAVEQREADRLEQKQQDELNSVRAGLKPQTEF